jgi:ADP-ribose pyrophosphatase YjhB (NUDIX family)
MIRQRVAAIIIKNKKILLVEDFAASHKYPPGGSIEKSETKIQALKRELKEELCLELISQKKYISFELINVVYNKSQIDYCFIVKIKGEPKPDNEIKNFNYYTKKEILNKEVEIPSAYFENLIPQLIKDNLI